MATSPMSEFIQYLRGAPHRRDEADRTDGELLECFVRDRAQAALGVLVQRHGPMVWGVCRRVLRDPHDAEDAFQATFLVLVRKAAAIVPPGMVAPWLYGVAHRTALKARATVAKRREREKQLGDLPEPAPAEPAPCQDLQLLIDQELSRLPTRYRSTVVLCGLEGKTRKEAAQQLGLPEGTVASRLARARALLARRLTRRGLTVTGAALAAVLTQGAAPAAVPPAVVSSTIQAATALAAGQGAAGAISVQVAALTEGVLKALSLNKLKVALVPLLVAALCGVAWLIYQTQAAAPVGPQPNDATTEPGSCQEPGAVNARGLAQRPQERATLNGHTGPVSAVAITPNGRTLASASHDRTVKLWGVGSGKELATLEGHQGMVTCVAFSPDGKVLASGSWDRTVKLWDVGTAKERVTFKSDGGTVDALAFTPDGKTLAWGCQDGTVQLRDVTTGKQRATLKGHARPLTALAVTPDGKTLASGDMNGTVKLWDLPTRTERAAFRAYRSSPARSLAFSPDGRTLASGGGVSEKGLWVAGEVKLWSAATGKELATLTGHPNEVQAVVFSPDGKLLASGGMQPHGGGEVKLWDVTSGRERASIKGHVDGVRSIAFTPDGKTLASASYDKTVKLWDLAELLDPKKADK
jgi:RNA polymerase sigma factor (sigma-70 family)